jgi:hypothetical protein
MDYYDEDRTTMIGEIFKVSGPRKWLLCATLDARQRRGATRRGPVKREIWF